MLINNKKYELQYIRLGLPSNTNDSRIGHVLKTEVFESVKEINHVINKLVKTKGYRKYDKILLSKSNEIKINIKISD